MCMSAKNCQFLAPKFAFFGQIWRPPLANRQYKENQYKEKGERVLFLCCPVLCLAVAAGDNMAALIICNMI